MSTTTANAERYRSLGDHTWQVQAVCHPSEYNPVDPDVFFPGPDEIDKISTALSLCAQCPVRLACLDAALEGGETDGIRGGYTEEERAPLHKEIAKRLDYGRVNAALAGRDIHLTTAERHAVVLAGYRHGVSTERIANLLKITEDHAQKLYRKTRRAIRNRELQQDARTTAHTADTGTGRLTSDDFGTAA
ncbi:WhiB family transcriptional regulator [Kitasatospora sp. NPDC057198]|uniref:WhiB family transcriptional regulator n=1 Tax=Kitasatospora sp. NPDC057198 TaxID=3346046 RepID=UPI003631D10A